MTPDPAQDMTSVLIYGINYAPELIGVGKYTGELGDYLAQQNWDVTVVTAPPHYPGWQAKAPYRSWRYARETWNGASVYRCPLLLKRKMKGIWRLIAPLSFAATSGPVAIWQCLKRKPRTVLVVEPTLFVAPAALFAAWLSGSRTVLHVQDLEVDAAFAVGHLGKGGLMSRLALAFERAVLRRFDHVVSISNRMIERLVAKGVEPERISLIRNWVDTSHIRPMPSSPYREELGLSAETRVVLYSGNLGAKQGLDVLCEAARLLAASDPNILFVIAGDGPAKAGLQARFGDLKTLRFLPLQPYARLGEFLNLADVHVIPQERAAADLVLPSKLGGILATGRPLVVTAESGTELAEFLQGAAEVVAPGEPAVLGEAVASILTTPAAKDEPRVRIALAQGLGRTNALGSLLAVLSNALMSEARPRP